MSKPSKKEDLKKVICVYKDPSLQDSFSQAFGASVYEIPQSILDQYASEKACEPDIFPIFETNIVKICRNLFGI